MPVLHNQEAGLGAAKAAKEEVQEVSVAVLVMDLAVEAAAEASEADTMDAVVGDWVVEVKEDLAEMVAVVLQDLRMAVERAKAEGRAVVKVGGEMVAALGEVREEEAMEVDTEVVPVVQAVMVVGEVVEAKAAVPVAVMVEAVTVVALEEVWVAEKAKDQ